METEMSNEMDAAQESSLSFFSDEVIDRLFSDLHSEGDKQREVASKDDSEQSVNLDYEDLQFFWNNKKNANTQTKTLSDLRTWYQWCKGVKECRKIEEIPPKELDRLLGHFYSKVRSVNGSLYETGTLTSIQRSLDRYLTKDHHKPYSIIRDTEFRSSQQLLIASKKMLKKEGKGNKSKASQPLEDSEIEQLWMSGALGCSSPEVLQNTVWFLLCLHLGMRGRDEHYKLHYGDLEVKCSSDGAKYVEFSEQDTKTRTGEGSHTRPFKPKMWSTPKVPDGCPVLHFEKYILQRPPEMCQPKSPFYLAVNYTPSPGSKWYKNQRIGKDRIGQFMKRIASEGDLKGKKTNHSVRKTMITTLASSDIPDTQIMQLSGHRNIQSLNSYKKASLQQQQNMSHILSGCSKENHDEQFRPKASEFRLQAQPNTGMQLPGVFNSSMPLQLFQGASISHSTIHINCNTSNLATQDVTGTLHKTQD